MNSRAPLSNYEVRVAGIVPESYVDGPGVRFPSLYRAVPITVLAATIWILGTFSAGLPLP